MDDGASCCNDDGNDKHEDSSNLATDVVGDEIRAILTAIVAGGKYGIKIRFPHAFVMTLLFRRQLTLRNKAMTIGKLTWRHAYSLARFVACYKTILALLKWTSRGMIASRRFSGGHGFNNNVLGRGQNSTLLSSSSSSIVRNMLSMIVPGHGWKETTPRSIRQPKTLARAPPGRPEHPHHAFLAGLLGGYAVWGRHYTSVHYQIVLYLASRVAVGCAKLLVERIRRRHVDSDERRPRRKETSGGGGVGGRETSGGAQSTSSGERGGGGGWVESYAYPVCASFVWATVMTLFECRPDVLHPSLRQSMLEIYRAPSLFLTSGVGDRPSDGGGPVVMGTGEEPSFAKNGRVPSSSQTIIGHGESVVLEGS